MRVAAAITAAITLMLAATASAGLPPLVGGAAAPPAGLLPLGEDRQYVVAPHDTLYGIARHFGISVAALAEANGLRDPAKLRSGTVLRIPGGSTPGAHAMARSPVSTSLQPVPVARGIRTTATITTTPSSIGAGSKFSTYSTYVVRPGDTLYSLARTHGVAVIDLTEANHLAAADHIRVGQVLQIPVTSRSETARHQDAITPPPPLRGALEFPEADIPIRPELSSGVVPRKPVGDGPDRSLESTPPPLHPTPGPTSALGLRVTNTATRYLGTPYVWGGAGPAGVDCSGLVYLVYAPYVPRMPRTSYDQWAIGAPVDRGDLAAGDLVFFDTDGTGASHVGIYIGDGQFVHPAARANRVVIDRLDMPYYAGHYLGARRIL